jgi:AbrB family looped-hinge helix DNA binding protein
MATATVTSKGQITIPVEVRRAMGLEAGDEVEFVESAKGRFALQPRNGSIRDLAGCVHRLSHIPTVEQMNEDLLDEAAASYAASVAQSASADEAA